MKKLFRYIEPMWLGNDGKFSLRSAAAIALLIHFICSVKDPVVQAALITSCLALKTWQNIKTPNPPDTDAEETK